MSFGISATNGAGKVTISSNSRVLFYWFRGEGRIRSQYTDRPGYLTVVFQAPVPTQSPPHVFIKMRTASHSSCTVIPRITGTPGNWTGFTLTSGVLGGSTLQNFLIDYVICTNTPKPGMLGQDSFGIEIFDENGSALFDSGQRVVSARAHTKTWRSYAYWFDGYYGGFNHFPLNPDGSDMQLYPDDYVDITAVSSGPCFSVSQPDYSAVFIWRNSATTFILDHQGQVASLGYFTPEKKFSVPICQFPLNRYP